MKNRICALIALAFAVIALPVVAQSDGVRSMLLVAPGDEVSISCGDNDALGVTPDANGIIAACPDAPTQTPTASATNTPTPSPTVSNGVITIDSRNGEAFGLMQVNSGVASVGESAGNNYANSGSMNRIVFSFDVDEPGLYAVSARVRSTDNESNSLFVWLDRRYIGIFDTSEDTAADTGGFVDVPVSIRDGGEYQVSLVSGSHEIAFVHREDGTELSSVTFERIGDIAQPTPTPEPSPTATPGFVSAPVISEADYILNPGSLNNQWPRLRPGDVVFLNPGTYSGGSIDLSVNGSADNPVIIQKTPGTSGKVIIDGNGRNTLFYITGSHIHIGGTRVGAGWEPDLVVRDFSFSGMRMYREANDIRIHHIEFDDTRFGIRINGQNVVIEHIRTNEVSTDPLQAETGSGGTNIDNMVIRYSYFHNALAPGREYPANWRAHTDTIQVQSGPARNIQYYGNLAIGFTNAILLGDSWGSVTNFTARDNFIVANSHGFSSSSKGRTSGEYVIENNTIVFSEHDTDGSGHSSILLARTDDNARAAINCNVIWGWRGSTNTNIHSSINVSSRDNLILGSVSSVSEIRTIRTTASALGWSLDTMFERDNVAPLRSPIGGADCVQGAPFVTIGQHLEWISRQ